MGGDLEGENGTELKKISSRIDRKHKKRRSIKRDRCQ